MEFDSNVNDCISFDLPTTKSSMIKVIGVGGGGGNAVNHMANLGINGVNFVVCNTDAQALDNSPIMKKIQLGSSLTEGRGAGNKPEIGREAAKENLEDVRKVLLDNTKMVFVTAGMGGGTGTGAAPVIAKEAKSLGILTVGIVTIPFRFEGPKRIKQALEGIAEMEKHVDSLLIINNEKLREEYGNLKVKEAFSYADDILAISAKSIAEIITIHGHVNVDFADVSTVMRDSGVAIMGSGTASGENRGVEAIKKALSSPLLNNNDIRGARNILINITSGDDILLDEMMYLNEFAQDCAGYSAGLIWGNGFDSTLKEEIRVTVIATGFNSSDISNVYDIEDEKSKNDVVVKPFFLGNQESDVVKSNSRRRMKDLRNSTDSNVYQKELQFDSSDSKTYYEIINDSDPLNDGVNNIMTGNSSANVRNNDFVRKEVEFIEDQPAYLRGNVIVDEDVSKIAGNNIKKYNLKSGNLFDN